MHHPSLPINFSDDILQKILQNPSHFETTSIDGKPFLNPLQFSLLKFKPPSSLSSYNQHQFNTKLKVHKNLDLSKLFLNVDEGLNPFNKKRNFQSLYDYAADSLEKKVKTEANVWSLSTQKEKIFSDVSTVGSNSPATTDAVIKPLFEISEVSLNSDKSENKSQNQSDQITEQPKKVFPKCFAKKLDKLKFKVKCQSKSENDSQQSLSREDILKADPLLLIYFYEKHLQFNKSTDFDPKTLKKL